MSTVSEPVAQVGVLIGLAAQRLAADIIRVLFFVPNLITINHLRGHVNESISVAARCRLNHLVDEHWALGFDMRCGKPRWVRL